MGATEPRHLGAVLRAGPAEPRLVDQEGPRSHDCRSLGFTVADVVRWHTRAAQSRHGPTPGIKNQHGVLRAALAQAVAGVGSRRTVAAMARLRSMKVAQRTVISVDEVRAVMRAARTIDRAAELALRIAAVAGARRAELASLRWTDERDGLLLIDSAIEITKRGEGKPELRETATKTANVRTVSLDGGHGGLDHGRCATSARLTERGCSPRAPIL
jgi:integrase